MRIVAPTRALAWRPVIYSFTQFENGGVDGLRLTGQAWKIGENAAGLPVFINFFQPAADFALVDLAPKLFGHPVRNILLPF